MSGKRAREIEELIEKYWKLKKEIRPMERRVQRTVDRVFKFASEIVKKVINDFNKTSRCKYIISEWEPYLCRSPKGIGIKITALRYRDTGELVERESLEPGNEEFTNVLMDLIREKLGIDEKYQIDVSIASYYFGK